MTSGNPRPVLNPSTAILEKAKKDKIKSETKLAATYGTSTKLQDIILGKTKSDALLLNGTGIYQPKNG
jgi:hypothetical protein